MDIIKRESEICLRLLEPQENGDITNNIQEEPKDWIR